MLVSQLMQSSTTSPLRLCVKCSDIWQIGKAELHMTCNSTKMALQACRQEWKGEPLSLKQVNIFEETTIKNFKILSRMMFSWQLSSENKILVKHNFEL